MSQARTRSRTFSIPRARKDSAKRCENAPRPAPTSATRARDQSSPARSSSTRRDVAGIDQPLGPMTGHPAGWPFRVPSEASGCEQDRDRVRRVEEPAAAGGIAEPGLEVPGRARVDLTAGGKTAVVDREDE